MLCDIECNISDFGISDNVKMNSDGIGGDTFLAVGQPLKTSWLSQAFLSFSYSEKITEKRIQKSTDKYMHIPTIQN